MADAQPAPRDEEIALLAPFEGLPLERITVVGDAATADAALAALDGATAVGFDTESKPTFTRAQVNEGPHLVQFAVGDRAWLFPTHVAAGVDAVVALLERPGLVKVGFGLSGDRQLIARRFQARAVDLVDLDQRFRQLGFRRSLGVKAAVAVVLGRRFAKSKRTATSDWSRSPLDDRQKLYAANDAYAAWCVHEALRVDVAGRWTRPARP